MGVRAAQHQDAENGCGAHWLSEGCSPILIWSVMPIRMVRKSGECPVRRATMLRLDTQLAGATASPEIQARGDQQERTALALYNGAD
jgi:hypothetical protein